MDREVTPPPKPTIDRDRARKLKDSDRQKILTRRGLERTFQEGNGTFQEFFGLDNVMKAFVRLNADQVEQGVFWRKNKGVWSWDNTIPDQENNYVRLDDLCLEEARLRKQIRSQREGQAAAEIEAETLRVMLDNYSPNITLSSDLVQEVKKEPSDSVLNIGDPDHAINKQLDRQGVLTIDYEDGFDARARGSKKVSDITSDIDEHSGYDTRESSFYVAMDQLDEWCWQKPGENRETDWYCDPRNLPSGFFPLAKEYQPVEVEVAPPSSAEVPNNTAPGQEPFHPETKTIEVGYQNSIDEVKQVAADIGFDPEKIGGVGIVFLESIAERLSKELEVNPTPENMELAKQAWDAVIIKLDQNPRKAIKYDTSDGYHPFENYTRHLSETARNASLGLEVLKVYQTEIFPEIIHKHLEELADIHVSTIVAAGNYNPEKLQYYRGLWSDFLASKGVDSAKFRYDDPNSHFVDLLVQFFLLNGIGSLRGLAPNFFEEIENMEKQKIRQKFPQPVVEKEAEFVEMMFPQTQSLPAHLFKRILMSWSWSAHMLKDTTTEELVQVVWPELDRLLAVNGIANIFPIGHHGVDPKWVEATIQKYLQNTGAKWEVDISRNCWKPTDNEYAVYKLLQIKKVA